MRRENKKCLVNFIGNEVSFYSPCKLILLSQVRSPIFNSMTAGAQCLYRLSANLLFAPKRYFILRSWTATTQ